jgi:ferritin-like metal-binding protein YciE
MAKLNTLKDLFIDQLKDLYSAETQLIAALPKMATAASDETLKLAFDEHLEQTKMHAERLEGILGEFDELPGGKKCQAMAGLIAEGSETIAEDAAPAVKDAALIAAAQRVEHYEIAGYGTARTFADLLEYNDAAEILQSTLDEEGETDERLTEIALDLNLEAAEADRGDEDDD